MSEETVRCPYEHFVECGEHDCWKCGWNPYNTTIREKRIAKAMRFWARFVRERK